MDRDLLSTILVEFTESHGEGEPSRRLKIVYHQYEVPTSDEGDVFTVKSYDADRYDEDIFYLDST